MKIISANYTELYLVLKCENKWIFFEILLKLWKNSKKHKHKQSSYFIMYIPMSMKSCYKTKQKCIFFSQFLKLTHSCRWYSKRWSKSSTKSFTINLNQRFRGGSIGEYVLVNTNILWLDNYIKCQSNIWHEWDDHFQNFSLGLDSLTNDNFPYFVNQ